MYNKEYFGNELFRLSFANYFTAHGKAAGWECVLGPFKWWRLRAGDVLFLRVDSDTEAFHRGESGAVVEAGLLISARSTKIDLDKRIIKRSGRFQEASAEVSRMGYPGAE